MTLKLTGWLFITSFMKMWEIPASRHLTAVKLAHSKLRKVLVCCPIYLHFNSWPVKMGPTAVSETSSVNSFRTPCRNSKTKAHQWSFWINIKKSLLKTEKCGLLEYTFQVQAALRIVQSLHTCSTGGLRKIFFPANLECWRRVILCGLHEQEALKGVFFQNVVKTALKLSWSSISSINPQTSLQYTKNTTHRKVPYNVRLSVAIKWHFHTLF